MTATSELAADLRADPVQKPPWWRDAVVYQVYVRSFAATGKDGLGDLPGITAGLPHLRDLGVDAVWLTPFYTSPQHDHGYDVADYRDVDPLFGTLADADALVATAHQLGLRLIVDLVPNHTSHEHAWFREALAAGPGSPQRARYLFRDGHGPEGTEPPNNWQSVFGGPAWTRVEDGQWYLHLFDSTQPDLDWRHPEVGEEFESVLRFWLDRGVDGFRVDVAHGLFKEASLRDQRVEPGSSASSESQESQASAAGASMVQRTLRDEPMWDQPEVHGVYRRWRRVLADYPQEPMMVAEAWTQTAASMAQFVRPDEMHQSFNFSWLLAPWSAMAFRDVITGTLEALAPVGASPTWVLSNHDVVRHPSRYGGGPVGLARARAATLAMLALPGSSYLYQGEELGLEQVDVAPGDRQDPAWLRRGLHEGAGEVGRDGCRVPLPWAGETPPYGFGDGVGQPWLPQPAGWAPLSAAAQAGHEGSTLEFYRAALAARREHGRGTDLQLLDLGADVLAFVRGDLMVVLNCGTQDVALPAGEVVLASGELSGGRLPADTAVWLA